MADATATHRASTRTQSLVWRSLLYATITIFALLFTAPFVFTVGSSLKAPHELHVFPPTLLPDVPRWQNYVDIFQIEYVPYALFYRNTIIITLASLVGAVASASATAYGFARFRWPGRDVCFIILLATLILPEEVVIIPKFLMFHLVPTALFGETLIDTWWPLILPSWFGGGAFSVFLLRQFFMQLPRDLDEAAVIDGANTFQIFTRIVLPLAKPGLATVAIFSFLGHWNDFIHPLIYLNTPEKYPLSVGLRWLIQQPTDPTEPRDNLFMAASVLMLLPAIVLFFSMQRYFIQGVIMSGIKG